MNALSLKDVCQKTNISSAQIYRKLNINNKYFDPEFPKPREVGLRRVVWSEEEINKWLTTRPIAKQWRGSS